MLDSNSIWPSNGIIGSEQIQIPDGINTKWPDGDALVGNFVYKEGKLVGFVDCKSLVINDSKSTTIPYDYANADFPNILKDTMTITGGERCKNLIVNCLEDAAVYITPMLKEILGDEAKFVTEFIKEENKLVVHTDRLDDETLTTVNELLERVLPQNIVIQRANYLLPAEYKWVEYLESTGTQWIDTGIVATNNTGVYAEWMFNGQDKGGNQHVLSCVNMYCPHPRMVDNVWVAQGSLGVGSANFELTFGKKNISSTNFQNSKTINFNETSVKVDKGSFAQSKVILCGYSDLNASYLFHGCIYSAKISEGTEIVRNIIPCIDPTGAPCMYDLVSRKSFYNSGSGDFLYPTDAAPAAAIGMDDKFYAKLTEHGVRRLYKVPDGCNMTKDEYAAGNGFKEIVEPPMPQTGYWIPDWRETDTQIVCEWIESEPPTEI